MTITVSQERRHLRYLAVDAATSERYEFSHPEEEQAMLIQGMRSLGPDELEMQISESMLEVEYGDDGKKTGSVEPRFRIGFGGGIEEPSVRVDLTEEEMRRKTAHMDEMMDQSVKRARSRVRKLRNTMRLGRKLS